MLTVKIAVHQSDGGSITIHGINKGRNFIQSCLFSCPEPSVSRHNLVFICGVFSGTHNQRSENSLCLNALHERIHFLIVLHLIGMPLKRVQLFILILTAFIACGYTDLRLGIDGLVAVVTQQYDGQLNEESLFLFCGRRTDRIKALYWTGDGYILLYKRLSNGRFQWPRSEAELKLLDPQSFRWLMEGLRIEQKTAIRKGRPKDLF